MEKENLIFLKLYDGVCGRLLLGSLDGELCLCTWTESEKGREIIGGMVKSLRASVSKESEATLEQATKELDEYFRGERKTFDVPLRIIGSDFQRSVLERVMEIPYGETVSYGDIAEKMGSLSHARVIGQAIAKNPLCIFVPCHRVVGRNGSFGGFSGGLKVKAQLLSIEAGRALEVNEAAQKRGWKEPKW